MGNEQLAMSEMMAGEQGSGGAGEIKTFPLCSLAPLLPL